MFSKITTQKKIYEEFLEQLIEQLRENHLHAGDKLPPERALADQLGVSRPAVRESIRALELLGIIESIQGDGNYLTQNLDDCLVHPLSLMFSLSQAQIQQAQELRSGLEIQTAILAARQCTPSDSAGLNSLLERLSSSLDVTELAQLDYDLHYKIAEIAGNQLILSVLKASSCLMDSIITGLRTSFMKDTALNKQIESQHRLLVEAISNNEDELAQKAMQSHMKLIENRIKNFQ